MTTLANFEREAAELKSFQFWRFRFVLQSQLAVTSSLKPAAGRHTGRHTQTHKANKYIQIVREGVKKQTIILSQWFVGHCIQDVFLHLPFSTPTINQTHSLAPKHISN